MRLWAGSKQQTAINFQLNPRENILFLPMITLIDTVLIIIRNAVAIVVK